MESKRLNSKVVHSEIYYNTKEQGPCSFVGPNSRGVKRVPWVSGEKDISHYLSRLAQELRRDPSQVLESGYLFEILFVWHFSKCSLCQRRFWALGSLAPHSHPALLH